MTTDTTLPTHNDDELRARAADRELVAQSLRLGRIDFLNMYPLHWSLGVEPEVHGVPTKVNAAITAGDIDAACMSSVEYARHADELVLLPSMCVSAEGAVGSIFAISTGAFEDVREVWLTPHSATSVVLLQLLMRLRGVRPTIHMLDEPAAHILAGGDHRAVLLIGDDALRARSEAALARCVFTDLGERWLSETGLPMVYAVWAVRRDAVERAPEAVAALDRLLVQSVRAFAGSDDAVAQSAHRFAIDPGAAERYFDLLCYDFAPNERKGLLRFMRMAHEQGFLDAVPQPTFAQVDEDAERAASVRDVRTLDPEQVRQHYLRTVGSSRALDESPDDDEHVARCLDMEADARALDVDDVLHRATDGQRISELDALALLQSDRLVEIGQVAHALRLQRCPADEVSFIVDRNINYSNVCLTDCGFCAFYATPGDTSGKAYTHSYDTIIDKVRETIELGGTAALMQGGHNPDLDIAWYEGLLRAIKSAHPTFHLHALSPPEIQHISRRSKLTPSEVLARLRDAGLDSLPGGGGEVLVDRVRRVMAPKKTKTDDWLGIMRIAQRMGMSTTASMMYGHVELLAERVLHLQRVRDVQDETRGFRSFTSWTFQPGGTALGRVLEAGVAPYQRHLPPTPTPTTYLLTQAVGRIYLDNLDNVQSSWVTQGLKVGQVALMFGANDLGSIMIEENVVSSAGTTFRATSDDFVHLIRTAGYTPVQRDTLYREVTRY